MNLIKLDRALRQLRLSGMAAVLEMRLHQAQTEPMAPIDLLSCLVFDELGAAPNASSNAGRSRRSSATRKPLWTTSTSTSIPK
jgi:hypothetical protein